MPAAVARSDRRSWLSTVQWNWTLPLANAHRAHRVPDLKPFFSSGSLLARPRLGPVRLRCGVDLGDGRLDAGLDACLGSRPDNRTILVTSAQTLANRRHTITAAGRPPAADQLGHLGPHRQQP